MAMIKNEVTKVNYMLTMNEDEYNHIQNALYKIALHEVKKKAEVEGLVVRPEFRLFPDGRTPIAFAVYPV